MTDKDKIAHTLLSINIEDEMKQSYVNYAMSVIVGRALPDVRDGLKPVHRRVLFAMKEMGVDWNKPFKKSARVVGDTVGKYHPHGESAVYDTLVRMAQSFSLRYLLVDGQGNFGSVDGDPPAAMRYTEVRMQRITNELLQEIDFDTVDFVPNYDNSEKEPAVFPARFPNLLANGTSGIAVGMATNIPPHNLGELIDGCVALIKDSDITVQKLLHYIKGPDFPTAAFIGDIQEIQNAYLTGRGRVAMMARTHFEQNNGTNSIIVTELPYQVNKARLLEKIADLVREKKVEGIRELRDESDKDGMRMVITLRRGESLDVVLNQLLQFTQLRSSFGVNMVVLVDGQPRQLNLKEMLEAFLDHRREVVTRKTRFKLIKAQKRVHILTGLAIAFDNIDDMVSIIRRASNPAEAKQTLCSRQFKTELIQKILREAGADSSLLTPIDQTINKTHLAEKGVLTETQAQAILEMRLQRLTGLEREKIAIEFKELVKEIQQLSAILEDATLLMEIIRQELLEIKKQFGDKRKTEIVTESFQNLTVSDLTPKENVVVTMSHVGYTKRQPLDAYRTQHRGGRGRQSSDIKDADFIEHLFIANTHDYMLCFSSFGKLYWLNVYDIPEANFTSRGKAIVNLLPLSKEERITTILSIDEFRKDRYVFMATANGTIKKCSLDVFSRPRSNGIIAINLDKDNRLVAVALTDGEKEIMLFSDAGKAIRFKESDVRKTGRGASGVKGMTLKTGDSIIAMIIVEDGTNILTASENGYGKRTAIENFSVQKRGGRGVIAQITSKRNGKIIGAQLVQKDDQLILINNRGTLIRIKSSTISKVGRNTAGVRLVQLDKQTLLSKICRVQKEFFEEGKE